MDGWMDDGWMDMLKAIVYMSEWMDGWGEGYMAGLISDWKLWVGWTENAWMI
jgi:hypothetical protein